MHGHAFDGESLFAGAIHPKVRRVRRDHAGRGLPVAAEPGVRGHRHPAAAAGPARRDLGRRVVELPTGFRREARGGSDSVALLTILLTSISLHNTSCRRSAAFKTCWVVSL